MNSGADAVAFDLEDSVEATQKEKARALIAEFLRQPASSAALRLVRFNAVETEVGRGDLDYFRDVSGYDGVLLPKVETPGILETVGRIFGSRALAGRPCRCCRCSSRHARSCALPTSRPPTRLSLRFSLAPKISPRSSQCHEQSTATS